MNNSFSFSRLWQLILKQGIENARFYLLYYLAILGVILAVVIFWMNIQHTKYYEEHFYAFMHVALFLSGTLFANLQFDFLSRKARGIAWLSFPASHLEKLLCAVFYTFIVFNLVFLAGVLLAKWLIITCITIYGIPEGASWMPMGPYIESPLFNFALLFVAVQAFYLLGSVYFTRFSFVKTTVAGLILIGAFFLYMSMLNKYMLGSGYWPGGATFRSYGSPDNDGIYFYKIYHLSPWLENTVGCLLKYGWAPAFWIITWKRLAEKEI
ncbi:hypothetical protein EDD80_102295 [Anseongella ginsenosidimutans]|uniref:ABC-2 type transport system permease protein n=1 Tax=Anseongella ginsenosidimutans TaxID=496056 RepID=A0A4R3KYN1_9SPHI|nr:hypothetical protein [Anseongella ginsenosidimutans]QEC51739.1 hypothetical protein FRZ59_04890 [Anseongella ginsenosidimutans]TCS89102.1 hypothetical protein EDD80_102295 [Anseongella ginsenosidimutans]